MILWYNLFLFRYLIKSQIVITNEIKIFWELPSFYKPISTKQTTFEKLILFKKAEQFIS
jgi:hypothetical protein